MSEIAESRLFPYAMFGLRVHADRPVPGLAPLPPGAASRADVSILFESLPEWAAGELAKVSQPTYINPARNASGHPVASVHDVGDGHYVWVRLTDSADYLLDRTGSSVWVQPVGTTSRIEIAHQLLGPIMALVLRLRGLTCLHASAISVDGRVVAFAGPQGAGKSTLAAAFATRGCRIVSDDIVALVDTGPIILAQPSYPYVWLRPAFGEQLARMAQPAGAWSPDWDGECLGIDLTRPGYGFEHEAHPLAGVYILEPPSSDAACPRIDDLSARDAVARLAGDTWSRQVLDSPMRAAEFDVLGRLMTGAWAGIISPHSAAHTLPALCDLIAGDIEKRVRRRSVHQAAECLATAQPTAQEPAAARIVSQPHMTSSARVGIDPVHVVAMENHDAARYAWQGIRAGQRLVVHVDAHHDLSFQADGARVHIGNYLSAALREHLVREIFWVVPDPTWKMAADRAEIVHQVRVLTREYPGDRPDVRINDERIVTSLLGQPLTVGPLAIVREIREPVLLDIDTDYMVLPHVYGESDAHRSLPWCWPSELFDRLRDSGLSTDLATLAYSVDGGYTPLKWKYLGDELAARLRGADPEALAGFDTLRRALEDAAAGAESSRVVTALRRAETQLGRHAAPPYHLCEYYADRDLMTEARDAYRRAVALDATYRTPYRNPALEYFAERRYSEAERAHRRSLAIDPEDATAHFGLGRLAAHRSRWREAEEWLRQSLALDDACLRAYRLLGDVLTRQGRHDEAIEMYERSLMRSLAIRAANEAPAAGHTDALEGDAGHFAVYAELGRLHARRGEHDRAIDSFRLAIAGSTDTVRSRWGLGRAYAARGTWGPSLEQFLRAAQLVPGAIRSPMRTAWRRFGRRMRTTRAQWLAGRAPVPHHV